MSRNLVVVESKGKIPKISKYLGKNFVVKNCDGIFRDLDPKPKQGSLSINIENNFEPQYIITKPHIVKSLRDEMKKADMLYIASDLDREGFGIAQSIYDVLKPKNYKRIVFNNISEKAVKQAIKEGGPIDKNKVNAQKARRVLDRLYGYIVSSIVNRKLGGNGLSAGRTQSVAARMIVDKENEIEDFLVKNKDSTFFKVKGLFENLKSSLFECESKSTKTYKGKNAQIPLHKDTENPNKNVLIFLKRCIKSTFTVTSIEEKPGTRSPSPPFTTSTLQQEANRKLGFPIDVTMNIAQKLYEGGFITYMRTDSVEISEEGQESIKKVVLEEYGKEYYQKNIYKNKSKNSQEAHEAIRPVYPEIINLENEEVTDSSQIKLYNLIWKRAIASQMKPAKLKITTIQISISEYMNNDYKPFYYFQSQIEKVDFLGFMKVYVESVDEKDPNTENIITNFDGKLPKIGDVINPIEIIARQEYKRPPVRYTPASLVKKLEDSEIGRPSTYANTVKTILNRNYVKTSNVAGISKDIKTYIVSSKNRKLKKEIEEDSQKILLGKEKNKLIPTELGITVTNFLIQNFTEMMDYEFTANIEKELDEVAVGNKIWHKVVKNFYERLKNVADKVSVDKTYTQKNENLIGEDENGNKIYLVTSAAYGSKIKQILDNDQVIWGNIPKNVKTENITIKKAISLLPKIIGKYENKNIILYKNDDKMFFKLGPNKDYYNVPSEITTLTLDKAIKIIKEKQSKNLGTFNIKNKNGTNVTVNVLNGPYGFYLRSLIGKGKKPINYKIPNGIDPKKITKEQISEIISVKKTTKKNYGGSKTDGKSKNKKNA